MRAAVNRLLDSLRKYPADHRSVCRSVCAPPSSAMSCGLAYIISTVLPVVSVGMILVLPAVAVGVLTASCLRGIGSKHSGYAEYLLSPLLG